MNFKLRFVSLALLLSVALCSTQPRVAQSAIGIATGNNAVAFAGLSIFGAAGLVSLIGGVSPEGACTSLNGCSLRGATNPIAASLIIGFIVLDGGSYEFGPLSKATARESGLTDEERQAYSDELAEIVAINEVIQAQLAAEYERTGDVSIEHAKSLWLDYGSELSVEAFSAVKKVSALAVQRAAVRSSR